MVYDPINDVINNLLMDNWSDSLYISDLQFIFNQMTVIQRQVVEHRIKGLTQQEIADILKISKPAVNKHLNRAKKKFLQFLGI